MLLRFETATDRNGNKRQLVYNTETHTVKKGYFLFCWADVVKVKNARELDALYKILIEGGATVEND